ncbi:alpha/beta fold hydrolase [Terrabacter carboxydivorans]|uniref:AB hydrolase-1 domain-containing protein n=1 Tax=Terrabacter carboxydivorans TaxID=619730 RepID=A0ABP5YZ60_9MICO
MTISSAHKSTIVRSFICASTRVAEPLTPSLGARLAERLWFRLPSTSPRPARHAGATPVRELLGSPFEVALRGRTVRGWTWGQGPVVYLVHGWGGTLEQLTPLVAPLLDRRFQVVAFDGLSHGRSDPGAHGPASSDAVELGRSLDAVAARFGPARAVVAHSMGALSTLLAVRDGWLATERVVLLAPPSGIPDLLEALRSELGLGERTMARLVERVRRRTGYAPGELGLATIAATLTDRERPELLVVHDLLDREVPHEPSRLLVRSWPGAQLLSTAGLGHRRLLADAGVGGAVARFVDRLPVEATLHGEDRPQPLARASRPEVATTEEAACVDSRVGAA